MLPGDEIMHGHTSGQVAREVIEEAEEWRPDAAVVGWVAGCSCGWRGTPWTRVTESELADPAARRLTAPGPWADLDAADETRVIQEWRTHTAPWRALEDVEAAATRHAAAARTLDDAVHAARVAGADWADIGRATGTTPCTAAERWPAMPEQATGHPRPTGTAAGQRTVLVVDLDGELSKGLRKMSSTMGYRW